MDRRSFSFHRVIPSLQCRVQFGFHCIVRPSDAATVLLYLRGTRHGEPPKAFQVDGTLLRCGRFHLEGLYATSGGEHGLPGDRATCQLLRQVDIAQLFGFLKSNLLRRAFFSHESLDCGSEGLIGGFHVFSIRMNPQRLHLRERCSVIDAPG